VKTLAFQDDVYKLRAETQQAFDEAKALEMKARQLERKQQELHQVYTFLCFFLPLP
jgi:ESCRT-I complex subunit VPS37